MTTLSEAFMPIASEHITHGTVDWRPIFPVPADAPQLTRSTLERYTPPEYTLTTGWRYLDAKGRMLGYVVTQTVVAALIKQAKKLPSELYKSLTWDRGKELTDHRRFTLTTNIDVYFCDPQSPWQRGSNENTNGLLRQYFPEGTDLSVHSQAHLNRVARQLNERPRETLQFETPAERFNACVASTG
jgi:hypothetical protein